MNFEVFFCFCFADFAGILGGHFSMLALFEGGRVFVKQRLGGSTLSRAPTIVFHR